MPELPDSPALPTFRTGAEPLPEETRQTETDYSDPLIFDLPLAVEESPDGGYRIRVLDHSVPAKGTELFDPIYTDLDGDNSLELLYWCSGPIDSSVMLCAYGIEQGWPVLRDAVEYQLDGGSFSLTLESGKAFCHWSHPILGMTESFPVTLQDGTLCVNDGTLPSAFTTIYSGPDLIGRSFAEISNRYEDRSFLLEHWNCRIWEEPTLSSVSVVSSTLHASDHCVIAALTDNGVTVTGVAEYYTVSDGSFYGSSDGIELITAPILPETLKGQTYDAMVELFGPLHFNLGRSRFIPCWLTEDGKLLMLIVSGTVEYAELLDLTAGEPLLTEFSDYAYSEDDTVIVFTGIPTTISDQDLDRWAAFLYATQIGEEDAVSLRIFYGDQSYSYTLMYDGERYELFESGTEPAAFPYLIADEETPQPGARYKRAVHYFLSDNPDIGWEDYISWKFSSYDPSDRYAETALLFSYYET